MSDDAQKAAIEYNRRYLEDLKEKRRSLQSRLRKAVGLERKVLKAKRDKVRACAPQHSQSYAISFLS